jgi:hypothetical protein
MKLIRNIAILAISLVDKSQAVFAGWAFGMNNYTLDQMRQEMMLKLRNSLKEVNLGDFSVDFMGENHFYNNIWRPMPFNMDDVEVFFQDEKFYIDIRQFDCYVSG